MLRYRGNRRLLRLTRDAKGMIVTGILKRGRELGVDRRGASAVEFGIVAFPLIMLILALAEMGFDFFCRSTLDVVAQKSARQIQIGTVQTNNLDVNGFKTMVCGYLPSFLSCSNLVFNVQTVPTTSSFSAMTTAYTAQNGLTQYNINPPSLNQGQNRFCPGQSNQFVVLQYLYAVPVITGYWLTSSVTLNGKSVRVVSTTQVFRNEAFTASNTGAGC